MITRFAEWVAQEIEAGRFSQDVAWFDDSEYLTNVKLASEEEFTLYIFRTGWFWSRYSEVILYRNNDKIPLLDVEKTRLIEVWSNHIRSRKELILIAQKIERKRLEKLAGWP